MKKMTKLTIALILALLILGTGISFAMHHSGGHSGHGSSAPATSGHDAHAGSAKEASGHGDGHMGMAMTDNMEMLGAETLEGVKVMAHITDMRKAMAQTGMKQTHHFMVAFEDEAKGVAIESGRVAVRIVAPSGQTSSAIALQEMDGHFGADVELTESGNYTFDVGSQVADGKNRQFRFDYEVK